MIDVQITELSQLVFLFFFFTCVIWAIYCLLTFIAESNKLRLRLSDLELELRLEQRDIPQRRGRVAHLRRQLPDSKRLHYALDAYCETLRGQMRELEEREKAEEEAARRRREEEEARGRIKLREWDF